ncbi:unnamed protein product [Strongylus vulgaris]|uniref:Uncharacterized protein n=1 Tax=Strongylus vulgaris TaxID=40348 RepID=A0A3P7IKG7_STRVU|nr:unnamed protein product [Strongylus vulgaris]
MCGLKLSSRTVRPGHRELCPESASAALKKVDGKYKIGEAPSEVMELAFLAVREELEHAIRFEKYKELIKTKRST